MPVHGRRTIGLVAGIVASVVLIAGCSIPTSQTSSPAESSADAQPAAITITPPPGAQDVDPMGPVTVNATDGTLDSVVMANQQGTTIAGVMTPDNTSWKPDEPLGYGKTYTLTIASRGDAGTPATQRSTFTTVEPRNQTKAYLTTTAGNFLTDGGTYGVGTVIVAHFDEEIGDRAAAEQRLSVTTDPPVEGSWYWVDDQNAHWRPQQYFQPGTKITAEANVYGVQLGDGLYGQEDSRTSFTIGASHVSIVDDTTKQVSVYENGALMRIMPTSMGMGGSEVINGQTISFWTQPGTYTVMDKANPVIMDSSTYGLPVNSKLGYKEAINYATRISTDGVYLHQLDSTVWAQGNTNVSHGCLNLNADNAQWFFNFSQPGDVVEIKNTGGAPLEIWQNGDWSVSWNQWLTGSALV
ncbi:Ig-like domain-containing protein [Rhodococcus opacus]|uniref:L,D-transpeptidase n=1 Tax=Rhodococcus TaxID=1827 RepID=UPI00131FDB38|nr:MULTISPECIES: Ig-like domain-containing protein [Rhodococcus]MDX5961882.1 Ig-like domain-containing protein [Rhodococcus opacus]QHE74323.1 ErfK/YbiS/YcfS/YnhG family protein [Rhodococcus sp. WAY2]